MYSTSIYHYHLNIRHYSEHCSIYYFLTCCLSFEILNIIKNKKSCFYLIEQMLKNLSI